MLTKLFKNLADYRWLIAFGVMLLFFLPFDFTFYSTFPAGSLLKYYHIADDFFLFQNKAIFLLLTLAIIIFASLFHQMLIANKLLPTRHYLSLFYTVLIIALWYPVIPTFYDLLTAGFLFLGINSIFASENSGQPLIRVFDATFLISISCVLNIYLFPFLLLPFLALFFFRQFSWQFWASALTGIIVPHFFLMSANFFFFEKIFYADFFYNVIDHFQISLDKYTKFPFAWAITSPLFLISTFRIISSLGEKKIIVRKKTVLLLWVIFFALLLFLISDIPVSLLILIIAMPFGYFISFTLRRVQEKRLLIILTDLSVPAILLIHLFLL